MTLLQSYFQLWCIMCLPELEITSMHSYMNALKHLENNVIWVRCSHLHHREQIFHNAFSLSNVSLQTL